MLRKCLSFDLPLRAIISAAELNYCFVIHCLPSVISNNFLSFLLIKIAMEMKTSNVCTSCLQNALHICSLLNDGEGGGGGEDLIQSPVCQYVKVMKDALALVIKKILSIKSTAENHIQLLKWKIKQGNELFNSVVLCFPSKKM